MNEDRWPPAAEAKIAELEAKLESARARVDELEAELSSARAKIEILKNRPR